MTNVTDSVVTAAKPHLRNIGRRSTCCLRNFNPLRAGTELSRFNYIDIMATDALAPYVAMTSAAVLLTM